MPYNNQSVQAAFLSDPRYALQQQIQRNGVNTAPVQSALEGLARLGQAFIAKKQGDSLRSEYDARDAAATQTVANAFNGVGSNGPIQVDQRSVAQALMQNPDTAQLGQQMLIGSLGGEPQGFTLGEGQKRFDAQGNVIAEGSQKTGGKPVNIVFPDGSRRAFRPNDPKLDEAISNGGTVVGQNIEAGSASELNQTFGKLSTSQQVQQREEIDQLTGGIEAIDRVLKEIEKTPSDFGLVGTVKGIGETASGITSDLGLGGVLNTVQNVIQHTPFAPEMDNKTVSRLDPEKNTLKFALARARQGGGKLLASSLQDAANDVQLTGFTSSAQAKEKLEVLRSQLEKALQDQQSRLSAPKGALEQPSIQDGTIIENSEGQRMILQGGQWQPL